MDYLVISIASAAVAALTLFSGFGLGTLLMPVFAIFFPVELAVALTAIVHFLNNVLKLALLGRFAEKSILIQFGISAILGAFLGTFLGNRLVKKVTMHSIQMLVSVMLLGIAIGLAGGLL